MRAVLVAGLIYLTGCAQASPAPLTSTDLPPTPTIPITVTPFSSATPAPSSTPTLPPTLTPTPLPRLCAPLAGYALTDLPGAITNPFAPPPPGSDDPHQAIDLSVRLPGSQAAAAGNPVQAVLAGVVASVIHDRFPYGNAILIETPLEAYPVDWWAPAQIPTPAPTLAPRSALTCPAGPPPEIVNPEKRSLYVLYAHMQSAPELQPGDPVTCGQAIGLVGSSGNALNPHLHLEVRVAPSGLRLGSLSHYDASATTEEMRAYCLWRVSGLFQLIDPMQILRLTP